MQVPPTDAVTLAAAPPAAGVVARVEAGNLAGLPLGVLLAATVTQSGPRETVLDLGGRPLTLRTPPGFPTDLPAGTQLAVRLPPTTNPTPTPGSAPTAPAAPTIRPTLELVGRVAPDTPEPAGKPQTAQPTATTVPDAGRENAPPAATRTDRSAIPNPVPTPVAQPAVPAQTTRLAAVDVLAVLPDGRVRIRIDGAEEPATPTTPLPPGNRYILAVERTPAGLTLRPPPDTPRLAAEVATAVLRAGPSPDLAAAIKPLLAELTALRSPPTGEPPGDVRRAADAVLDAIRSFLPPESRPPNAKELRHLVENGGLHFEAKLARLVPQPDAPPVGHTTKVTPQPAADATTPGRAPPHEASSLKGDLKGELLRLLQVAQELGTAPAPAARAVVNGIEAQQVSNAVAQTEGTAYFLQVPFPDAGEWRTLHLAVERESRPLHAPEGRGNFRLLMHVPLTDLGETWIDAGLTGHRFRAVLYLDRPEARDRVRAELPGLQEELAGEGFEEVLLDVRPTADLPASRRRQGAELRAGRPESVSIVDVRA